MKGNKLDENPQKPPSDFRRGLEIGLILMIAFWFGVLVVAPILYFF